MRTVLLISLLVLLIACKKTPVLEASEAMVGTWVHHTSESDFHKIIINENGSGSMEWIVNGKVNRATKVRDWYLDDNELFFGKAAFNGESYEINKYPTFTWEELVKYYDTIPESSYYIILDGVYYVGQ